MITRQTRQRDGAEITDSGDTGCGQESEQNAIISDLEAEIDSLEQRLQQFSSQKLWKEHGSVESTSASLDSITHEIQELEQLVKENEILSGLTISEASFSILEQDATSSLRQHSVTGEAGGVQFKVQYDVRELFQKSHQQESSAEVLSLEMDVRDDMVALLRPHLYSVAADLTVRELFQLLASYGSWVEDRERAINHFASTFPELVQRVDANDEACNISMVISDPKQDVKFRVLWGLKVPPMKIVVPDLQLQVEASPEVLSRDKKGTLDSSSEVFHLMCKKFGIESALHMLVRLVDEAPP